MSNDLFEKKLSVLEEKISILPDKPEENPLNTLKALWLKSSGTAVSAVKAESCDLPELSDEQVILLDELIEKRINGTPLSHITGRQLFMGLEMLAGPEALIPRKETEILGITALEIANKISNKELIIIDVCTGAGNIASVLANALENSKVYAADLSENAVELAKKNAEFLGLSSKIEFYSGDLLDPLDQLELFNTTDLLTCNPPYISTSKVSSMPDEISSFEPDLAFDGGSFGINLIRRLITDAEKYLSSDGYLVFEVGLGQGDIIKKQVEKSTLYKNIYTVKDELDNPRVIVAQKL